MGPAAVSVRPRGPPCCTARRPSARSGSRTTFESGQFRTLHVPQANTSSLPGVGAAEGGVALGMSTTKRTCKHTMGLLDVRLVVPDPERTYLARGSGPSEKKCRGRAGGTGVGDPVTGADGRRGGGTPSGARSALALHNGDYRVLLPGAEPAVWGPFGVISACVLPAPSEVLRRRRHLPHAGEQELGDRRAHVGGLQLKLAEVARFEHLDLLRFRKRLR